MEPGFFEYYVIGINIIGFLLFLVNQLLYSFTDEGQIDVAVTVASFLGGSAGIILAMLYSAEKRLKKKNDVQDICCMYFYYSSYYISDCRRLH